ncbi:fungal specific transcription factor domain-containing protein [Paraphaeosphaeria sporulosa]
METSVSARSPQSGARQSSAPRRVRAALACQRCKGRKQKCEGGQPSCRSCIKAGITCVYEPTLRPRYPGGKMLYINALEERIAFLEAQLPEHRRDHFGGAEDAISPSHPLDSNNPSCDGMRAEHCIEEEDSTVVDGVAYLSLCASGTTDAAPEPFYMGSSSGATIARLIQSAIFNGRKASSVPAQRETLRSDSVSSFGSSIPTPSFVNRFYPYPQPSQAQRLFSVFFNRMHTKWPILDRTVYEKVYERQYDQASLPIIERCTLHLIYAISARFLQLTKQQRIDVDPEAHFVAAIEQMDYIMERHNTLTVQFLTLLAVYGQRSPYGAGVWSQVRYAMTLCVELGMHRKPTANSPQRDPRDLELRRRIFWSCYCLDRLTSMLLGRTFAISDHDINVELPSSDTAFWDLTSAHSPADYGACQSNVIPFIHDIKLRKLQSKIQRTVFRVDIDQSSHSLEDKTREDAEVESIRHELDTWVNSIPVAASSAAQDEARWMYEPEANADSDSCNYFTLQYHKAILSLYTNVLPTLSVDDHRFSACAQSAARMCSTYKRLNQLKVLSFTIIALHSCFVAGLTLVYCLWRDKRLFNFEILEATRSCSQCLTIFGERWPGAARYGEIFETLQGSVIRAIMEPKPSRNLGRDLDMLVEPAAAKAGAPNHTDPLLGAVKDVFMEVDEDVPGGGQGWRLFTEMVQSDIQVPELMAGERCTVGTTTRNDFTTPNWSDGTANPLSSFDEAIGAEQGSLGDQGRWDHGFFAGYD